VNCKEGEALTFEDPESFLAWLRKEKPKVYAAVEKKYLPPTLKRGRSGLRRGRTP
jgi:hypothetical protein